MTKEDILEMEAGRELDALVAERVMGPPWDVGTSWRVRDGRWERLDSQGRVDHVRPLPTYSTAIGAAWTVVERVALMNVRPDRGASHAIYGFGLECEGRKQWKAAFGIHSAPAATAPLAIARAALLTTLEG